MFSVQILLMELPHLKCQLRFWAESGLKIQEFSDSAQTQPRFWAESAQNLGWIWVDIFDGCSFKSRQKYHFNENCFNRIVVFLLWNINYLRFFNIHVLKSDNISMLCKAIIKRDCVNFIEIHNQVIFNNFNLVVRWTRFRRSKARTRREGGSLERRLEEFDPPLFLGVAAVARLAARRSCASRLDGVRLHRLQTHSRRLSYTLTELL